MTRSLLLTLPLILAACVANPPKQTAPPAADYACNFLPERPAPGWVQEESTMPGYFVGKGSAGKATSVDEQKTQARNSAFKNLAQSIRVSVQSNQSVDTQVSRTGGRETVTREVRDATRISSDLSMNKVESAGEWLDPAACRYHVRLRWSESALRFERLRGLLAEVKDPALPLPERHQALESAEALLPQIDFSRLPEAEGEPYYRKLLAQERQSVVAQKTDAIAVVLIDKTLPASLARDLLSKLPGGQQFKLEALTCNRLDDCVSQVRRHGAEHLLFVRISHSETPGKMGGRTGKLNIEITLANARTGKTTWGPKRASEALLTFSEFADHDWREALAKAAEGEPFRPMVLCLAPKESKTCS